MMTTRAKANPAELELHRAAWCARSSSAWFSRRLLAAVAVGIARQRALDPVPRVADGFLRLLPGKPGTVLALLPPSTQLGLEVVEGLAGHVGLPAVTIGRGVDLVRLARAHVRPR